MPATHELRPTLPSLPARMKTLPVDERGYPVPFFVAWIDGKPDHRVADPAKWARAHKLSVCYLCGQPMGAFKAFVVGPMCGVNRIASEPPSHRECAEFAAAACPFLSRPRANRRAANLPDDVEHAAGDPIARNPGVTLIWITKSYRVFKAPRFQGTGTGYLIEMGAPVELLFRSGGRVATREEIDESVTTGLPFLEGAARKDGPGALRALEAQVTAFTKMLPGRAA